MKSLEVSPLRATFHYFSSDIQNILFTSVVACFLGKHIVSRLGKDAASFAYIQTIETIAKNSFLLYEISSVCKSSGLLGAILVRSSGDIHEKTNGDFPREDNRYELRILLNTLSLALKTFSSLVVINKIVSNLDIINSRFSQKICLIGGGSKIAANCFDFYETRRAAEDQEKDEEQFGRSGSIPLDKKLKDSLANQELRKLHRKKVQEERLYDQAGILIDIFQKAIDIGALQESFSGLNKIEVSGGLLVTNWALSLIKHIHCGATIQQLQKGDVLKEEESK